MPDALAADQLVALLALAIPGAALATLLIILFVSRRRRQARSTITRLTSDMHHDQGARNAARAGTNGVAPDHGAESAKELAAAGNSVATFAVPAVGQSSQPAASLHVPTAPMTSHEPAPHVAVKEAPEVTISRLVELIASAENAGENGKLAQLYFDLARAYRADGRPHDALSALRSAAGIGSMHGPKAVHALARVELGEAALAAGDRTGACEQWQMAKMAFHDEGLKDAYALTDKRMRDNGCPTDWVLTEF